MAFILFGGDVCWWKMMISRWEKWELLHYSRALSCDNRAMMGSIASLFVFWPQGNHLISWPASWWWGATHRDNNSLPISMALTRSPPAWEWNFSKLPCGFATNVTTTQSSWTNSSHNSSAWGVLYWEIWDWTIKNALITCAICTIAYGITFHWPTLLAF